MSAKAVFQSQALGIYLSGQDVLDLSTGHSVIVPLEYHRRTHRKRAIKLFMFKPARLTLQGLIQMDQEQIDVEAQVMATEAAKHKRPGAVQEDLTDGR
jgi:hypothetical protein